MKVDDDNDKVDDKEVLEVPSGLVALP